MPTYNMPDNKLISGNVMNNLSNSYGGSSAVNNSSNVRIVINGSNSRSAKSIANQVAKMIRNSNSRRDHSRSTA